MNADIATALNNWEVAEREMRAAVAKELEGRAVLIQIAFATPTEGTNNRELGNGYVLKGMFRNNYTLDNKRVEDVAKALPPAIRKDLFKWTAELSISTYKALEPAHKRLVNEILTIKPGRPSVAIVQPKER